VLNIDWNDFFRRHPVTPQVDDDYLLEEEPKPDYWDEDEEE